MKTFCYEIKSRIDMQLAQALDLRIPDREIFVQAENLDDANHKLWDILDKMDFGDSDKITVELLNEDLPFGNNV